MIPCLPFLVQVTSRFESSLILRVTTRLKLNIVTIPLGKLWA